MAFTPAQLWECAEREARMRQQVYPRLVEKGRMSQAKADLELEMMIEIAKILQDRAQSKLDI